MSNPSNPQGPRPPVNPHPASPPPPPPPGYRPPAYPPPPQARGRRPVMAIITAVFGSLAGIILSISLVLNLYLGIFFVSQTSQPVMEKTWREGNAANRIVILPVEGMIDGDMSAFVNRAMDSLEGSKPAAIVLRVDSGGGGVSASDEIWHRLYEFRQDNADIPIVASFGSIAASGGYYVASPADYIVAEPTCITGSIGVMAMNFTIDGMMKMIGVSPHVLVADQSPEKDVANNMFREWTPEDSKKIQVLLNHFYDLFVERVETGRQAMSQEEIRKAATGDIFTAEQAKQANLIDGIGFIEAAIKEAETRANLPPNSAKVTIIEVNNPFGFLGPLGSHAGSAGGVTGVNLTAVQGDDVRNMMHDLAAPRIMYMVDWQ